MGRSAQAGYAIFKTQATPHTIDPDLATDGVAVKLRSGSLGPNRDLLIPDSEIGGGRDVTDAYLGAISWSGDYEIYPRMDSFAMFLANALGSNVSATTTGVSTHTATPSDSAGLPFMSIEEGIAADLEAFQYYDCVVNTLHLESDANGYLMGTVGVIGMRQTAGVTRASSPAFDNGPMIVGTNIGLTYNGVTVPAKSFNFDLNNNIEDDDFRLGSLYLNQLTPKRREVTVGFSIRPEDSAMWRQATYGTSAATTPGGLTTRQQLIITMSAYESIPGGTPTTSYSCTITIPKFILKPYSFDPSGDDVIQNDVEGQAIRPVAGTPLLTVVTKNGTAALP